MSKANSHSSGQALGARFGWRVWPGAVSGDRLCRGGSACLFAGPHPLGQVGDGFGSADDHQIASAWVAHPDAPPLLLADDHLDLVGADSDVALAVLDHLADNAQLLCPVVMHIRAGFFLVAPDENLRWREMAPRGRGITLPPWIPLPSESSIGHLVWQVPPTPTNAARLLTYGELADAFSACLPKADFDE